MTTTPATREACYVRPQSQRQPVPDLPDTAPLPARLVHSAYYTLTDEVQEDIRACRNSRRVGVAFAQLDTRTAVPLRLSRRERREGITYLVRLHQKVGGVL